MEKLETGEFEDLANQDKLCNDDLDGMLDALASALVDELIRLRDEEGIRPRDARAYYKNLDLTTVSQEENAA